MKTLFNQDGLMPKTKSRYFSYLLPFAFYLLPFVSFSQETQKDSLKTTELKEVVVASVRAKDKNPITYTNVSKEQIAPRNLGQDVPVLMQYLPSVVSTTDAGNGVGYTYMRVRGSDGSRINVTLNGVPFNDSESQGTFFVNLPDFASSLESVQLQRGVGTSTNGAGAFGASLNMATKSYQEKSYAEIANSFGSFNTRKHTLSFGTGLHNNFELNGRISNIASDGFIDRASSNMFGYFFNANYVKESTLVKFMAFGGKEKTYQAWYGIEDPEKLRNDRTFNPAGMYFDENGNMQFYDNETDNYWQNHFQLHWTEKWTEKWISNTALHYTKGKGYFEQYKEDEDLTDYNLPAFNGNSISDLVRKRWLDNDFFGATFSLNYRDEKTDLLFGGAANRYLGLHYGEVIWTTNYIPNPNRYYDNYGNKDDVNFYTKASYNVTNKLNLFADLQYRMVFYNATSVKFDDVNDTFRFFNPKAGLNYQLDEKNTFYGYFGIANKEPRRDDYESGAIKPERLFDYELGWKYNTKNVKLYANAFYMRYNNQLVMTGALNDVGSPIFTNSGKSYRLGLEVESTIALTDKLFLNPNFTLSQNKNIDFYFQRDGIIQDLGNTNIAYSPNFVAANSFTYLPVKGLQLAILSKFVGEQYMGNIDSANSKLDSYFVSDFNASYDWQINKGIKSIVFSALVNNIFNLEYESNGYFYTYDDTWSGPTPVTIEGAGFYPQAGINFILGATLKF
ncbi:TonB-dependent receptor [Flavobacterium cyclinae]|uniref:TonB-dependent receptor n=1 Tax=Flavobacterium cyclinae TaxID=2895947 RepID=UPI001E602623|nr:TonB-dependent receptor [Flavobacterium cyclinae]UGS21386.1 TonB-dependent receptor [Flavobacterium cyclinae]